MTDLIEDWFDEADTLLFNNDNPDAAQHLYSKILEHDPANIDALNSIAYCVRACAGSSPLPFDELRSIYERSLRIDNGDIEANFNLGLVYLEKGEMQSALKYLVVSVERD
jgi:tetratricopeptide (TPR) repeat protein